MVDMVDMVEGDQTGEKDRADPARHSLTSREQENGERRGENRQHGPRVRSLRERRSSAAVAGHMRRETPAKGGGGERIRRRDDRDGTWQDMAGPGRTRRQRSYGMGRRQESASWGFRGLGLAKRWKSICKMSDTCVDDVISGSSEVQGHAHAWPLPWGSFDSGHWAKGNAQLARRRLPSRSVELHPFSRTAPCTKRRAGTEKQKKERGPKYWYPDQGPGGHPMATGSRSSSVLFPFVGSLGSLRFVKHNFRETQETQTVPRFVWVEKPIQRDLEGGKGQRKRWLWYQPKLTPTPKDSV